MQDRLIFLIGSPRSGSTMLARMLGSHSAIFHRPEPHLLTPLAHLGYYENVAKAPYDHLNAATAQREFVEDLPRKEEDYLDACRAYTDTLYGLMLETSGKKIFLDKTPAYALVLDFLVRIYPNAKYIVLTRHPLAIFSSYANSFFEGDYEAAQNFNPILNRYVPAIAKFLRERPAPLIHTPYEDIVHDPAIRLEEIFAFLGIPFEKETIEYGRHEHDTRGRGDPITVGKRERPTTESVDRWTEELARDDRKLRFTRRITDALDPEDLKIWGYTPESLYEPLQSSGLGRVKLKRAPLSRYRLERKLLLRLRKNIHRNLLGRIVRKVRFYCDVLLRE